MWVDKKPSFQVYKGLAAPIYVENLHIRASGKEAQVVLKVKDDLPSYTLRKYTVCWKTVTGMKKLELPDLKPGERYTFEIDGLDPLSRPDVKIFRPTGYLVTEY